MTQPLLQAADLRAATRLPVDTVASLAGLITAVQERNDAALVQDGIDDDATASPSAVRRTMRALGALPPLPPKAARTSESLLRWLTPALAAALPRDPVGVLQEEILAGLNGVLGDHLATSDHPLAIRMQFRRWGRPLPLERHALRSRLENVTPRLLVLVHDLCMNDLHWQREGHDHGEALARAFGYTPVYLHYNTGLSVSTNGRILAHLMEGLYSAWPVPIDRLVMIGHGMGGLVTRSAMHHGPLIQRGNMRWPGRVNDLVCLGTPHQGTTLLRAGKGLDMLLGHTPYAEHLSRLGRVPSAGMIDLRWGNVLKAPAVDEQAPLDPVFPLDNGRNYAIAANSGPASTASRGTPRGDGVVSVASALGQHEDPHRALAFAPERLAIVHHADHLDLLSSTEVDGHLRAWLA